MQDTTRHMNDTVQKIIILKDTTETHAETANSKQQTQATETIQAISSLWPLILTIFFIFLIILKWKNIGQLIDRIKFAKIAGQEVEFNKDGKTEETTKVETDKIMDTQATTEAFQKGEKGLYDIKVLYSEKKPDEARKLLEDINSKEKDTTQVSINTIVSYYFKYLAGYTSSISELTTYINTQHDSITKARGYYFIGECYLFQKSYELARKNYDIAYQTLNFSDLSLLLKIITGIGNCIEKIQTLNDKINFFITESKKQENKNIALDIYQNIAESTDDKLLKSIMLQLVLKEKGNDTTLLFDTSYVLADLEENVLAISYYKQLLSINPNDTSAQNNIGVSYEKLKVVSLSNHHFLKSSENGSTLATANLALNLVNSGFYNEAEKILERDRVKENIHENLIKVIDELKNQKDKETKRDELISKQSDKLRTYFTLLGNDIISRHATVINFGTGDFLSSTNDKVQIDQYDSSNEMTWMHGDYKHKISLKSNLFYGQAGYKITKEGAYIYQSDKEYSGYYKFNKNFSECDIILYNDEEIIDLKIRRA